MEKMFQNTNQSSFVIEEKWASFRYVFYDQRVPNMLLLKVDQLRAQTFDQRIQ